VDRWAEVADAIQEAGHQVLITRGLGEGTQAQESVDEVLGVVRNFLNSAMPLVRQ
jgi:ADP-heptose:LPS heptosyltransferase